MTSCSQRFADNRHERLPQLAAELVDSRIDLLATHGIPGTRAAKGATNTVPILMASVADPVAARLVSSYARPVGNVTGIAFRAQEMAARRMQWLKDALPGLGRVAVLSNPRNAAFSSALFEAMSAAAVALQLQVQRFDAPDPVAYAPVFAQMAERRMEALAITEEATLIANAPALAGLAVIPAAECGQHRICPGRRAARLWRRPRSHLPSRRRRADKLLRGAKPAELPVEQPTQFEPVFNARTAAAFGLVLPATIRLRADRVIDWPAPAEPKPPAPPPCGAARRPAAGPPPGA